AKDALKRMMRNPVAVVGLVIVALFVLLAAFAAWLTPKDPYKPYPELLENLTVTHIPGSMPGFVLGSDADGIGFFSRLLIASQQTLIVAVLATLFGLLLGLMIGGLAGARGGWVACVLTRRGGVPLSLPALIPGVCLSALCAGSNQWTVIIAVGMGSVPVFARL